MLIFAPILHIVAPASHPILARTIFKLLFAMLLLAAVLTGVGVGAAGSFLSDNAFWLAILIALAMLVAFVIGLGIARLARWRRGSIRSLSPDD